MALAGVGMTFLSYLASDYWYDNDGPSNTILQKVSAGVMVVIPMWHACPSMLTSASYPCRR